MPIRLLRRFVFLVTAVSYPLAAPELASTVRGDDRATTAHEAAVLDRIFANWKARSERVHSFHFVWNCRNTFKRGSPDVLGDPNNLLKQDVVLEQVGYQYWMDGKDRRCVISPVSYRVPLAKSGDVKRVAVRWVLVGDKSLYFFGAPLYEGHSQGVRPSGHLLLHSHFETLLPNEMLRPIMVAYRPQDSLDPWLQGQCRLLDEDRGGGNDVMFERVHDKCWVSPARGDVVVRWSHGTGASAHEGSIKYKRDKTYGWVPSEWSVATARLVFECAVTSYAINEKIDPRVFALEFPVGTPVLEQLDPDPSKFRCFLPQADGSQRTITYEEYERLRREPPKNPPAK
jgi:hypothetical protein